MRKSVLIIPGLVLASGLLAACNLISNVITEKLPSQPTQDATPAPLTPIVIPVILPTPTPPPPTTQPPAPGPTPGPDPPPTSNGCSLPSQSPATTCTYQTGMFAGDIEWAIDQVINTKPQFFDMTDQRGYRCPKVLNEHGYTNTLVQVLGGRGYCAIWDGEEVGLKNTQAFNEQYDILTAGGYVRRGPGAYRSTCRPAWF